MFAIFAAVLAASLVGSPHCAGMCGPLAVLAASGPASPAEWRRRLIIYHLARLLGYACLGAIAGAVGAAMDLSASLLGMQRIAAITAGAAMVVFGAIALARLRTGRPIHFAAPRVIESALRAGHRWASRLAPESRAAAVGSLTVLLPCGWLYAFVITAAGTARPWYGSAVMTSFWLGTLPALSIVVLGVRRLAGRWRAYLPVATSLLMIATGTYLVAMRAWTDYGPLGPSTSGANVSASERVDRIQGLTQREMPCCHAD